ncbi:NACHT domain-containing protein [Maribacter flavus]|uniref:NACHT domain-containing protein n=1 Tax=Maribacter flavus TaxID=1658664 RepID=A0A5B2TT85_9FLAO|nr:NACHT domain-containing protein [Maribacter flavus]KAA2217413.1 NACHT domain-containing protein [Maribacter flavus]
MKINRHTLIQDLYDFSQKGDGLIIGKPGVGKSYSLSQLSDFLWERDIPNYILRVDELDGSNASITLELGIEGSWTKELNKVAMPSKSAKAVLIFDGFDAARDEELQQKFLMQIRNAVANLTKWNILVSVRTYDATKSPQLLRIFSKQDNTSQIKCRHLEINELNEAELESVFSYSEAINKLYKAGNDELKLILRIPFFLRLLELVLRDNFEEDLDNMRMIRSESELLDRFWDKIVFSSRNSYQLESFLKELADCLVANKSMSYLKDRFIANYKIFSLLRSNDIISEVGVGKRFVMFSHNILFDYFVGRLTIPSEPKELSEFVALDKSRQFFLRPSFIFHFTRLWYNHRKRFWENYAYLNDDIDMYMSLFKRLIPMAVIANEYNDVEDLKPVIENNSSIQQILQSIRFLHNRPLAYRDIQLLFHLKGKLQIDFLWDYSHVFQKILDNEILNSKDNENQLGMIAREFLAFILKERELRPESRNSLDRLGSVRGIEYVSRTFHTNRKESKKLLKHILKFLSEPDFEIWYFTSLSDDIKYFVEHDPQFVAKIYREIFAHTETSTSITYMGTAVLNLTSNRKQDFEMCYYRLVEFYPKFLSVAPETAIEVGLKIVNQYVIINKMHFSDESYAAEKIMLGNRGAGFLKDFSSIWHDNLTYHKPAQLIEKIIAYFEEQINEGNEENLAKAFQTYYSNSLVSFTWKKIIELGNKYPKVFKEFLFQISLNQVILKSSDVNYEIGISLEKIYPLLKPHQRKQVENTILSLINQGEVDEMANPEILANRLLNCIPNDLLVLEKSIEFINSRTPIKNEQNYQSNVTVEPYTTDKWLRDKGVDLEDKRNNKIYRLLNEIESFNRKHSNDTLERKIFEKLIPTGKELYQLSKEDFKEELRYSALKEVFKFFSIITRDIKEIQAEDYSFVKSSILYGITHVTKYDESFDNSSSASSGYSPTPRIEASSALVGLLQFNNDDEIFQAIEDLIADSNPIVRFNIIRNISQVWIQRPKAFWGLIFERLKNESDSFNLSILIDNIFRKDLIENHENEVVDAIKIAYTRIENYASNDSFSRSYARLLLYFFDRQDNDDIKNILYESIENIEFVSTLVFKLFDFIDPKFVDNDYTNINTRKKLIQLFLDINKSNLEALKSLEFQSINEDSPINKRLRVLDSIVQRIYFSLEINENLRKNNKHHPSLANKRGFYLRIKPILLDILKGSNEIGDGTVLAHTAHYFIQTLNGVIKFYPEEASSILSMASEITKLSYNSGYTFDSSAIREVVSLTEVLLVDHKSLLNQEDSLSDLVSILRFYADSGWPQALEHLWKLDEAFK